MCLRKKQKNQNNNSERKSLGRDFFSIFDDKVLSEKLDEMKGEKKESESESLGRLFYSIFNDSVESKKLTREEKHRLYIEQNRKSIISAYNGDNVRELSLLYRCSQSDIIAILRESIAKNDKNILSKVGSSN